MSFSNIIGGGATSSTPSTLYGGVVLSDTTKQKRAQIKNLQDDFMTFAWGDCNAFEVFGAFILNDKKGSLKFFNGPGFSNEYSKPQFNPSGGELLGVTFQKQSISFTIGVYWISIEDYRRFLNWLSPNKTDYLYFGYDTKYRYNVKLSKRADSTKWVIGTEYVEGVKVPMYYTEMPLTFEIQGEPCAKGFNSYEFGDEWATVGEPSDNSKSFQATLDRDHDFIPSDLNTPFELTLPFYLCQIDGVEKAVYKIEGEIARNEEKITLFSVELHNLTHTTGYSDDLTRKNLEDLGIDINELSTDFEIVKTWNDNVTISTLEGQEAAELIAVIKTKIINLAPKITLTYNSMTGLLYLKFADSQDQILNLLTLNDTGDRIVKSCSTFKVKMQGRFSYPDFYDEDICINVHITKTGSDTEEPKIAEEFTYDLENNKPEIVCYPRTNII